MDKKIILKLESERHELNSDTIDIFTAGKPKGKKTEKPAEPDKVELVTEGTMRESGGRIEISYDESELSGLEGSKTLLIFDTAEPDTLTMIRRGTVHVTMVFSPGLRHICKYDNPVFPFELTLMTHSLSNNLLDNGSLKIDYSTELAGSSRARTRLKITLRDVEDAVNIDEVMV